MNSYHDEKYRKIIKGKVKFKRMNRITERNCNKKQDITDKKTEKLSNVKYVEINFSSAAYEHEVVSRIVSLPVLTRRPQKLLKNVTSNASID